MIRVTQLWNEVFSNEETGLPLSFSTVQGKEEVPPNMPEPRGLGLEMRVKVDVDHASDMITR